MKRSRGTSLAAAACVTAVLATAVPAVAGSPALLPAAVAPVPSPAAVPAVVVTEPGGARAMPGVAPEVSGAWVVGSPAGFPAQRTAVMVPGAGVPVWGDWDGDGLATPGRYAGGVWSLARERVGYATLTPTVQYGGLPQDVPVVGDWDRDGRTDTGVFRDGVFRWRTASGRLAQVAFGARGDLPVVGDWNGDGVLDVGVVRGSLWLLRLPAGAALPERLPASVRVVTLGTALGRTSLRRGAGTSTVRTRQYPAPTKALTYPSPPETADPAPGYSPGRGSAAPVRAVHAAPAPLPAPRPARMLSFLFGRPGDLPLVGDWDGDGSATPAIVRDRSTWFTARSWPRLARASSFTLPVAEGSVPVVVAAPRDAAPGRCLTASPRRTRIQPVNAARVVAPPVLAAPVVTTGGAVPDGWALVRDAARDQARYLVSSDLGSRLAGVRGQGYLDVLSLDRRTLEYAVRRPGNAAFAVAVARATGAFTSSNDPADPAPAAPEVDTAVADAYVDWLVRGVACQHAATSPGGWGSTKQSALWAYVTGMAAWYSWARLPEQVRGYVAAMVASEADAVAARLVGYWKNRDGSYVLDTESGRGDTRAEEMAWDGMVTALAAAMMPGHPHALRWRTALVHRAVASYARPADLLLTTPVNGIVPQTFLRGTNANDDGTVINQGTLAPDYTAAVAQNWTSALTLRAARLKVPVAATFNGARGYDSLRTTTFPADRFPDAPEPRGPVYQPDGTVYFPGKVSWGTQRRGIWVATDAQARVLGLDGGVPTAPSAGVFLWVHARAQRLLQARFTDGHSYLASAPEDVYRGGAEEYNAQQLSLAYWAKAVARLPLTLDTSSYSMLEPPR